MNTTTTSTTCRSLREDLKAYIDGELALPRRLVAYTHLSRCPHCQQEVRELRRIGREIRVQDGPLQNAAAVSPELRARLLTRLDPLMPLGAVGASRPAPYWRQQPLLVFGSGAVAVLIFTAVFLPLFKDVQEVGTSTVASVASKAVQDNIVPVKIVRSVPAAAAPTSVAAAAASAPAAGQQSRKFQEVPAAAHFGQSATASVPGGTDNRGTSRMPSPQMSVATAAKSSASTSLLAAGAVKKSVPVTAAQAPSPATFAAVTSKPVLDTPSARAFAPVAAADRDTVRGKLADAREDMQVTLQPEQNNATVGINVQQLEKARQDIGQAVKMRGGFVAQSSRSTGTSGDKSVVLTVKVPVEQFDKLMAALSRYGEITTTKSSREPAGNPTLNDAALTNTNQSLSSSRQTIKNKQRGESNFTVPQAAALQPNENAQQRNHPAYQQGRRVPEGSLPEGNAAAAGTATFSTITISLTGKTQKTAPVP